ncbi:hypothetical protein Plhal304r1_c023g0078621 [Plasmopara halstedii]
MPMRADLALFREQKNKMSVCECFRPHKSFSSGLPPTLGASTFRPIRTLHVD